MKNKILLYNSISPLIFQVITIICGFILPKLILEHFGSTINGLVNSISQFLGVIAFLELGVGAVVKSALYKPLADNDNIQISKIVNSANVFFRKLGYILLIYVIALIIIYPALIDSQLSFAFIATLIVAISIRSFAQYFFGIVNRLLLVADQKAYIQYNAQTLAVLVNTFSCFGLIKLDASIQIVYGVTSLIFLIQPFLIHIYVIKHYNISKQILYKGEEPIEQKWNGVAQHVSALILDSSDIIVLSMFSTLENVSIYSVYMLVVKGIKQLCLSLINGIQAVIGNLWAKKDIKTLQKTFYWSEWVIHTITVIVFSVTTVLIVPFVKLFTSNINDLNYIQPRFAVLAVLANALYCLSLPYLMLILAAGHYKQTQYKFIITALLNIMISLLCVESMGIEGVAIGTLGAMIFQLIWMLSYSNKKLMKLSLKNSIKLIITDIMEYVIILFLGFILKEKININTYFDWIYLAIMILGMTVVIVPMINYIFNKKLVESIVKKAFNYYFLKHGGKL